MREQSMRHATTSSCVKDVKDTVVNDVTRARHARAYTADKEKPFTSFTDTKDIGGIHGLVAKSATSVLALDLGQRTGWAVRNRGGAIARAPTSSAPAGSRAAA